MRQKSYNASMKNTDELDEIEELEEPEAGAQYDAIAYYYNLQYETVSVDLDFYRELARRAVANAKVLELACGTGRVSVPLARAGMRVTGLDNSEGMLGYARARLQNEKPDVQNRCRFVAGDMRDLDAALGNEQFDFVFCAVNSFQHLLEQADQLACLQSVRKHLAPVGIFVLDCYNPEQKDNYPADGRLELVDTLPNPERGSIVHIFQSATANPTQQQRHYNFFYDETLPDGTFRRATTSFTLRYSYRYELQLLLEKAGFSITDFYGSYDFDEFGDGSDKLIYVCRKG
jgi:SAM-dependent methyltransferase